MGAAVDATISRAMILCGTNRAGSHSWQVVETVSGLYERCGIRAATCDLAALPSTLFHPQMYDCAIPDEVATFVNTLRGAHALHIVCPEYNAGIPGALKMFLDLLPERGKVLSGCPVALVGVSSGASAAKPLEQLQSVLADRRAFVFPHTVQIVRCREGYVDGQHSAQSEGKRKLQNQLTQFVVYARSLTPLRDLFAER